MQNAISNNALELAPTVIPMAVPENPNIRETSTTGPIKPCSPPVRRIATNKSGFSDVSLSDSHIGTTVHSAPTHCSQTIPVANNSDGAPYVDPERDNALNVPTAIPNPPIHTNPDPSENTPITTLKPSNHNAVSNLDANIRSGPHGFGVVLAGKLTKENDPVNLIPEEMVPRLEKVETPDQEINNKEKVKVQTETYCLPDYPGQTVMMKILAWPRVRFEVNSLAPLAIGFEA